MLKRTICGLVVLAGLSTLTLSSGCASRRTTHASAGRVYGTVAPSGEVYNPGTEAPVEPYRSPIEPTPVAPPPPQNGDPPPPTRSTSDLPPAPPRDDFESAEHPGRHSARFFSFPTRVRMASQSIN